MNILLISYNFLPGFEGSTSLFTIIGDILAKNGHKVWVITRKFKDIKYKTHPNIHLIFVSSEIPLGQNKTSLMQTTQFTKAAKKKGIEIVKNENIDIIHSNAIAGFAGSAISSTTLKPHILLIHDLYSTDPNFWKEWQKQKGNSRFKAWLGKKYEKKLINSNYSAVHTVSEASKDDLIKFGVKKPIYVIDNGIKIKDSLDVERSPMQFVYVGRLVFYKNIQTAIKAIAIVKESHPKVSLIIVGRGPYRKNLEELVSKLGLKDNVVFRGNVDEDEKENLLASSQALVFPSLFEGFGLVILEAFMQKTPALVSDVRPLSDIVEHEKTGLVIPAKDENEWAKAIENIIQDASSASKMGETGRMELETKYTLEKIQQELENMYKEILNKYTN